MFRGSGESRGSREPSGLAGADRGLLRELAPRFRAAGTPVRRLRPLRGRRPGGPARGGHAVAGRRRTRSARGWLITVASRRRIELCAARTPAADVRRPVAAPRSSRSRPRRPTTRSRCSSSAATRRSPRPSQIALTLRAVGGLTTARDRPRLSGARGDHRPADQPGEADDQGRRRDLPDAAGRGARPRGWPSCCTCST